MYTVNISEELEKVNRSRVSLFQQISEVKHNNQPVSEKKGFTLAYLSKLRNVLSSMLTLLNSY